MGTSPPQLERLIRDRYDDLSRTLRRTAAWVLQNPVQVATRTLEELTLLSACSSTSFIRLAQELGYSGWRDFRHGFAQALREGHGQTMFAERLVSQSWPVNRQSVLQAEVRNIQSCFTEENAAVVEEAVERMVKARQIALIGRRSFTSVITWLHYLLRITFPDVVLADDRGGAFGLDLLGVGASDVVIAASFVPCSQDTVAATRRARQSHAWTLGIVDSSLSALARTSDRHIIVRKESEAFFDSMVGAMVAVQWLASAAAMHRGPQALERARAYRQIMVETGAFVVEELPRRGQLANKPRSESGRQIQ